MQPNNCVNSFPFNLERNKIPFSDKLNEKKVSILKQCIFEYNIHSVIIYIDKLNEKEVSILKQCQPPNLAHYKII